LQGLHESAAIEDALKHFEQAGELGYHEGYFELARLYDEGSW
jgi:TPR repeat protein